MPKWRFDSQGSAIHARYPRREHVIGVRDSEGTIVYGPYIDMPAGTCTARILVEGDAVGVVDIDMAGDVGQQIIASRRIDLSTLDGQPIELIAEVPHPVAQFEVRLHTIEPATLKIAGLDIDLEQSADLPPPDPNRPVGTESRKSYAEKIENGFIERYLSGPDILEVGYRGYVEGNLPIVPRAIGVDIGYPGYNGVKLPFADESFDAIYSSHCFEHIADYQAVLHDWYRLLKTGGYLIIVVPHQYLFEKKRRLPSRTNHDHKRFYTPDSLLAEIRETLPENGYRIRHLADQDTDYNYARPPLDHAEGRFEIEVVVQKIERPYWNLDDDTVRIYSAGEFIAREEFMFRGERRDPFVIDVDLSNSGILFGGPYVALQSGGYRATYYFDLVGDIDDIADAGLELNVAADTNTIKRNAVPPEALKTGSCAIPFHAAEPDRRFEFRMSSARPVNAKMIFKGIILDYAEVKP
jgi:SAM-dependent methyltransferase